jgi:hypothetical protein
MEENSRYAMEWSISNVRLGLARGMVYLALFLMGLFTLVALMAGYFQTRKLIVPQTNSQRMDTAAQSESSIRIIKPFVIILLPASRCSFFT